MQWRGLSGDEAGVNSFIKLERGSTGWQQQQQQQQQQRNATRQLQQIHNNATAAGWG